MAAYLVVDVDDLLQRFRDRSMTIDLQELAVGLRGAAALAAGLINPSKLKAIAVAHWDTHRGNWRVDPQTIFKSAGYEIFDSPSREDLADILIIHYFSYDPDPVDELILATTSGDLLPLIRRIKTTRSARIRMWGSEDVLQGTPFADEIIFQPLESLLGIQTKNVAVYIDFENISISLNEQGFVVNLDHLIERFVSQAQAHGNVVKLCAYAPWGQRGTLPPLVDTSGREVADDAPSRMMMANIDPVFNLPGKNSADIRIARDVITDAGHPESADVYILASGDRDFNEVINALVQKNKVVVVWGVRGSTSRQLENHPAVILEYIDDFTNLQTHQSLSRVTLPDDNIDSFIPSQWSSVIIQFYRLEAKNAGEEVTMQALIRQLQDVGAVVSPERGQDLVSQSISLGIIKLISASGVISLNVQHPIVEKTMIITDRIARRVANTLQVRGWEYVNYGFLLKGLEMERDLIRPGMNDSDQWRSHWIDCLVREKVLQRELVPHRHNPDDLVPVIRIPDEDEHAILTSPDMNVHSAEEIAQEWVDITPAQLEHVDYDAAQMVMRIIISVEQFTSFRNFAWCPLGSLHKRLREHDTGVAFQRAVEYLIVNDVAEVKEYSNPQSDYNTKGIELHPNHAYAVDLLQDRDDFIKILLHMYENNTPITRQFLHQNSNGREWDLDLWISIMETENVLNPLPGRTDQYSLFRTHHTVKLVAEDSPEE